MFEPKHRDSRATYLSIVAATPLMFAVKLFGISKINGENALKDFLSG